MVLVAAVLPAEYGIDPTGIGGRLGLVSMSAAPAAKPEPQLGKPEPELSLTPAAPEAATVWKAARTYCAATSSPP